MAGKNETKYSKINSNNTSNSQTGAGIINENNPTNSNVLFDVTDNSDIYDDCLPKLSSNHRNETNDNNIEDENTPNDSNLPSSSLLTSLPPPYEVGNNSQIDIPLNFRKNNTFSKLKHLWNFFSTKSNDFNDPSSPFTIADDQYLTSEQDYANNNNNNNNTNNNRRSHLLPMHILEPLPSSSSESATSTVSNSLKLMLRKTRELSSTTASFMKPIVRKYYGFSTVVDRYLGRIGNPILIRRLLSVIFLATILYIVFQSDISPLHLSSSNSGSKNGSSLSPGTVSPGSFDVNQLMMYIKSSIDNENIDHKLQYLSSMSHGAGTVGDLTLAKYITAVMRSYGLPTTERKESEIQLNYPDTTVDSQVLALLSYTNNKEDIVFYANLTEPSDNINIDNNNNNNNKNIERSSGTKPFIAYSASGNFKGHMVYANYGTMKDFLKLKNQNIIIEDSIVFIRFGAIEVGKKVAAAENFGAKGIVLFAYHDSSDLSEGYLGDMFQRAGATLPLVGDPSFNWGVKSNTPAMIPVLTTSWNQVKPFIEKMVGKGFEVDDSWKNGQPQLSNWWSGNKTDDGEGTVWLKNVMVNPGSHSIWNVVGTIDGYDQNEIELIIGAKRDSFCYGTVSAMSGTSVLLELVRVFSSLYNDYGWRPRRKIKFISWDASTYNHAGSARYINDNKKYLMENGAAYINLDSIVSGKKFHVNSHPSLQSIFKDVLGQVSHPTDESMTMLSVYESVDENERFSPPVSEDSDTVMFQSHLGMPSIDFSFVDDDELISPSGLRTGGFPKGSCYDSYEWTVNHVGVLNSSDSNNNNNNNQNSYLLPYHLTIGRIAGLLLLRLSDDPILPLDFDGYGKYISNVLVPDLNDYAVETIGEDNIKKVNFDLSILKNASMGLVYGSMALNQWLEMWNQGIRDNGMFEPPVLAIHRWNWNARIIDLDKRLLDASPTTYTDQISALIRGTHSKTSSLLSSSFRNLPEYNEDRLIAYRHSVFGPQLWPEEGKFLSGTFHNIRDALADGNFELAKDRLIRVSAIIEEASGRLYSN